MDCRRSAPRRDVVVLRLSVAIAFSGILTGCVDDLMQPAGAPAATLNTSAGMAGGLPEQAQTGKGIPDHYIVTFHDGVTNVPAAAGALAQRHGGVVGQTYTAAIKGFSARLPQAAVTALANNPNVAAIEQDQIATTADVQSAAPWALDRIDQSSLPLDNRYSYPGTGAGVHAYIIDSGILSSHQEFAGRMGTSVNFIEDGNGTEDCHGHGTHVAGIIGGATYGVAKNVTLHSVRVFGCSGGTAWSTVLAAIDWVTSNAQKPAVVNMSLSGSLSSAINQAVTNSIASGLTYAVAAGNLLSDACKYSPASTSQAITVAASTSSDSTASFSNWGSCVDLYAPGVSVLSAWRGSDYDTRSVSGTSMASPAVAGAAALYLEQSPGASASEVSSAIVATATTKKIYPLFWATNNSLLNITALLGYSGDSPQQKSGGGGGNGGAGNGKGKGKQK